MISNNGRFMAGVLSGHVAMAPVDVCKTPPFGMPIPYPNIAPVALMGMGYTMKTLLMGAPMYTRKSKTALTQGDDAGLEGGIMSQMCMGPCEPVMTSFDTFAEGGGVVRSMDMSDGNGMV